MRLVAGLVVARGGIVRMGVVSLAGILAAVVRMPGRTGVLVMAEPHALRSRHRGHALDRNGQGEEGDDQKPGKNPLRHRSAL